MNGNEAIEDEKMDKLPEKLVYMWGYLPGALPEKAPILSPVPVRLSDPVLAEDSWKDVCGGGCAFAMAISENGKLITWGSADDESQSYLTSGKHGEIPEPFPVPTEASVVKAAAGWAHCVSVTEQGEVYAWGWKECVPSGKIVGDFLIGRSIQKDAAGKQSSSVTEQGSPQGSNTSSGSDSQLDNKKVGEETVKRRKISPARLESDSPSSGDEFFTVSPSLVTFGHGVKITTVATGGRHTLALSDVGQVWGWGYGGEGQLGLGSRVKMVSSPHLIPCIEPSTSQKDKPSVIHQGSMVATTQASKVPGTYVKEIACGGRHSAVITDVGALLTFGWGLYGQCGQGSTADQLRPTCVPSLLGTRVEKASAGLWHTLCVTVEGHLYSFGGNQFGQLGTGSDHLEVSPRLLDASCLENKPSIIISCGARHSAVLTGCKILLLKPHELNNSIISRLDAFHALGHSLISFILEYNHSLKLINNVFSHHKLFSDILDIVPLILTMTVCLHVEDDDQIFTWGWNKYGQLGLGDSVDRNIPCQVSIGDCRPRNIACGWWHTLLLADKPV